MHPELESEPSITTITHNSHRSKDSGKFRFTELNVYYPEIHEMNQKQLR
jgi:hypothetical protein